MSFLDSVLTSLQTGKPSQVPLSQPPAPPATSTTVKNVDRKPGTPTPRPAASENASGGIKRKAEDQLSRSSRPEGQKPATGAHPVKGKMPAKKPSPEVPTYKGTAKPPPKAPEAFSYRGTAGLPGRGGNDRRTHGKRRMDEYLGTDEEDEGDYGGYDDYYSDASSDMEARFDDVEGEEDAALRSARREDEKELAMEMAAKREKLERQKKLAALASRTKR